MEQSIRNINNSSTLVPQYGVDLDPPVYSAPFAYTIKHKGDTVVKQKEMDDLNIFNRIRKTIVNDRLSEVKNLSNANSFGLGPTFIEKRKMSVQPKSTIGIVG